MGPRLTHSSTPYIVATVTTTGDLWIDSEKRYNTWVMLDGWEASPRGHSRARHAGDGRFHSKFWPLSQGPCMSHLFWWKSSSQAMNYALCVPVIGLPVSTHPSRCRSEVRCSGKLPASSPGCPLFALRASRADLYCHRHRAVTLCVPVSVYLNGRRHQVIFIFDFSASYTPGL